MGVITTFDEKRTHLKDTLYTALSGLRSSQDLLDDMLDPETWGHSDMSKEFLEELEKIRSQIVGMRVELGITLKKL